MERSEVYRRIDGERAYQQAQGLPDERTIDEWLSSINHYWCNAYASGDNPRQRIKDNAFGLDDIRKVAALAVAALEQYGCPPREGYEQPIALPAAMSVPDDVLEAIRKVLDKTPAKAVFDVFQERKLLYAWLEAQPTSQSTLPADVREAMVLSRATVTEARLALEHKRIDTFLYFPGDGEVERLSPILAALKEFDAYAAWLDAQPQETEA